MTLKTCTASTDTVTARAGLQEIVNEEKRASYGRAMQGQADHLGRRLSNHCQILLAVCASGVCRPAVEWSIDFSGVWGAATISSRAAPGKG